MSDLVKKLRTYAYACAADQRTSTAHIAALVKGAADEIERQQALIDALMCEHNEVSRLTSARPFGAKKSLGFCHAKAEKLLKETQE